MNGLKHQKEKRSRALLCFEMKTITTIGRFIMIETILSKLEQRLGGRLYARQRLGIETDHEAQIFGQGLTFFHLENWYSIHSVIRTLFKLTGLYWRGRANAARVQVRHNGVRLKRLPAEFDGLTLLHMSDFHADMNEGAMRRVKEILPGLDYDLCVLTGDYRAATFGPFEAALAGIRPMLSLIKRPIYGVLGNHDTIRMVPDLEAIGVRMLLNECEPITRGRDTVHPPALPVSSHSAVTVLPSTHTCPVSSVCVHTHTVLCATVHTHTCALYAHTYTTTHTYASVCYLTQAGVAWVWCGV